MEYYIKKYQRCPSFNKKAAGSAYSDLIDRGYTILCEEIVENLNIRNYSKYVKDYLQNLYDKGNKTIDDTYIYIWHVKYQRRLLDYKTLTIFRKKLSI